MDNFTKRLIKKYGDKVPKEILRQYKPAEKYVVFNDGDKDLHPIKHKMPEPPEYHLIDGFGKPASEQVFQKEKLPEKLNILKKRVDNMNDLWRELDDNRHYYREELTWIYRQWWYRLNGYWFFNNGVPTYITGANWFWLNWFKLENGYPDYLYRDRIFFLFVKYCLEATTATFFYRLKDNGEYVYFSKHSQAEKYKIRSEIDATIQSGEWEIDYGHRICYGFNYPKFRREGATSKAACINLEMISRSIGEHSYIQSMDEKSARTAVYDKIKHAFKALPFFFLPQYQGSTDPRDGIIFSPPSKKLGSKGSVVNIDIGLEAKILYTNSDNYAIDGERAIFYHGDETGKYNSNAPYDLIERWDVAKKVLTRGSDIFGLCINTSTSGDTKGKGGKRYRELCSQSHWNERNYVTGRTESGLFNLFISSEINLAGFTDKHGNPIISNPTEEQKKYINRKVGAREFLAAELSQKENKPKQYNQQMREFPRSFREAFMSSAEDSGFNLKKLTERITDIEMLRQPKYRIGNLVWSKDYKSVEFVDTPDGKFKVNQFPEKPNNVRTIKRKLMPLNDDKYVFGTDPVKFERRKESGKKSDAAAAIFRRRDDSVDSLFDDPKSRKTNKFIMVYIYDVLDTDIYFEDMMKASIYWGVSLFPEGNISDEMEKKFRDNGLDKFMKYRFSGGRVSERPGVYTDNNVKQQIFLDYMNYIEHYCEGEEMVDILYECRDIEGLEDMTNHDLFAAGGMCFQSLRYDPPSFNYYSNKSSEKGKSDDAVVDAILRMRNNVKR